MKCPSCGAQVGDNNIFCLSCGAKLDAPLSASAVLPPLSGQQPPSTLVPPANPTPPVQPLSNPAPANRQYQAPVQPNPGFTPATPPPNQRQFFDDRKPVSLGNWIGTLLLLAFLPVVVGILGGIISGQFELPPVVHTIIGLLPLISYLVMVLFWAFGKNVNPSKRNFFRATLILTLIFIVIIVVLVIVATTLLAGVLGELLESTPELNQLLQQFEQLEQLQNLPL